jgi:hypothetical protein
MSIKGTLFIPACALLLVACGSGQPVSVNEIPAYPGATVLQPGEDSVADTLAQNVEQDASIRASVGIGGQIEQMAGRAVRSLI